MARIETKFRQTHSQAFSGTIALKFNDHELMRPIHLVGKLSNQAPHILRRAINHEGSKIRTQVVRDLTKQTGLPHRVINRAVKKRGANYGSLTFELMSRGGNVALKYFKARETRRGVSAAPRGARQIFASTFIKGGLFAGQRLGNYVAPSTRRVPLALSGHVFMRAGSDRVPIMKMQSGVYIPTEMVTGITAARFKSVGAAGLQRRVEHEVMAVLAGYVK